MLRHVTHDFFCINKMPFSIDGTNYYTVSEITRHFSITRQTLWRWRSGGKIPYGHRFRDRQIVFTESELRDIEEYANRIEPKPIPEPQLSLFNQNWNQDSDK